MKRLYFLIVVISLCVSTISGQVFDTTLTVTESGTKTHTARNSVTLGLGYTYVAGSGSLTISIENPVVTGDVSYNSTPVDPETRTLNTSYEVGATNGSLIVNPMGGASYAIPFELLPGVNGLTPSLSLVYSSNSGPGMAGYGWQISGLSVISRGPKTYYHDNKAQGVELDTTDRFYLDGQRLVNTSGTYGQENTTYQTDIDIFTRVTSNGTEGNGPSWFKAETKSGLVYEYGKTTASRQKINGNANVVCWYATKISDLYGNQMNIAYIQDNFSVYPVEITYGPNTITFYYKQRSDKNSFYLKGTKIEQWLVLDKVKVKYNTSIVRTYEFSYNYLGSSYNSYSMLNEVIQYGTGTDRYNSTAITYQIPGNVSFSQTKNNTTHGYITYKSALCTGDFNGDGKADFVCLPDPSKGATWTGMRVYYGDGSDNFNSYFSETTSIDLSQLKDMRALDLNADGKSDLIYELNTGSTSTFYYMLYVGSSFNTPVTICSQTYGALTGLAGKRRRSAEKQESDNQVSGEDYNGDGVNDIFLNDPSGNWQILSFVNASGQMTSTLYTKGSGTISNLSGEVLSGDFNSDGKSDIWSIETYGVKIYTLNGSTLTELFNYGLPTKDHFFNLGDFNADGKVDVFLYGNKVGGIEYDWANWQIRFSTGAGFEQVMIPQKRANLKDDYVRIGDFNGDGASDVMVTSATMNNGTYFYISKNRGTDLYSYNLSSYPTTLSNFYLNDFNGDGQADFISTDAESPWWSSYKVYRTSGNTAFLLEKAGNGLGELTKLTYTKLSQVTSSVYQRGTGAVYPVSDYQGPLPVVSSKQVDNGKGTMNTQNYYYEGVKIHRQGKGFLGYAKSRVTDNATGIETESLNGYNTTYFYPQLLTAMTKRAGTNDTIEKVTNTWNHKVISATRKRIFPYIQTSVQTNKLTGHSVTITTAYNNNYGNPSPITKSYNNGITETTNHTYNNIVTSTKWLLGRPTSTTIQYSGNGSTITRYASRQFSTTNNSLNYEKWHGGTTKEIWHKFKYFTNGTVKIKTDSISNAARSVQYTYEADGVRIDSVVNPLGRKTRNYYDSYGRLVNQQDYLDNSAIYEFDEMGRPDYIISASGLETDISYGWENPASTPKHARYSVIKTGSDGTQTRNWFDKLGREIRSGVKGFSGTWIYTDTKYNVKRQTDSISEPYYSGGTPLWNRFSYDNYGRKTNHYRPTGRNSTWTYAGNTITETTAGKSYSKTVAADGTLTSATDPGGTITYSYYPDGKVKTIVAPGNITTSMHYDLAGNQDTLVDPSAGTIAYTYNGFGELTSQKNAKNQTTQLTYHADGRPDQRISDVEGTTQYRYIPKNKQLLSISSPGGVRRSFIHDGLGRITTILDSIPGSSRFITNFDYDDKGRLSTITHQSTGITETYNYNARGYLSSITAGGVARWTVTGMNARQQLTAGLYGSNLNATFGYDAYGFPDSTKTGTLQDYRYEFDPVEGTLSWRKNVLQGNIQEDFEYDDLSRLERVYRGPTTLLDMEYESNKGGITTKSDVGTSNYDLQGKPYALSSVDPSSGLITPAMNDSMTYTSFGSVKTITEGSYSATLTYGGDNQRVKMQVQQGAGTILTRWYSANRIIKDSANGVARTYTFIGGDPYTAPCVAIKEGSATRFYYLLRDYLGSITHVVDTTNTVLHEYSYDAWGRMRDTATWVNYSPGSEPSIFIAGRGFTGHEHLPWFKLINMNGRVYDPLAGQFLSPDNYVQAADFTQSYNRYSYCMNNPLNSVDLSGERILPGDWYCRHGYGGIYGSHYNSHMDGGGYSYNWNTGEYENSLGMVVSFDEVYNNYVLPNSIIYTYTETSNNKKEINNQNQEESKDGWTKVPGGYIATPGEKQLYYIDKTGRAIPSFRAENLIEKYPSLSTFWIYVSPNSTGDFYMTDNILFGAFATQIIIEFNLGLNGCMYSSTNLHMQVDGKSIFDYYGDGIWPIEPEYQSGSSLSWQCWGNNQYPCAYYFTLSFYK